MRQALRWVWLGIALCGPRSLYAKTELLKTQPGSLVHWSRAVITVAIDPRAGSRSVAPDDVTRALERASDAWNAVRAEQPRLRPVADAPDVTIRFCQGHWQGDTIDLGKSRFTASLHDGTVTAATVELNECDHRFAAPNPGGRAGYDLQAVLTHELGHVLGLGHSDNRAAIMYPSGGGASVRTPHLEDQTTLALIYFGRAPIHGTAGVASAPGSGPGETAVDAALRGGALRDALADRPATSTNQLPAGSVSLLSLKTGAGRNVMVYTCEPTLLPPMETAPGVRDRPPRADHPAKRSRR
jgi:predicted Zn-dependent protease